MPSVSNTRVMRLVRHKRVRRKVHGTASRPRLAVFRSLKHIYAQVIDDSSGHTLAFASSKDPEVTGRSAGKTKTGVSGDVGSLVSKRAKEKGISSVVFDTGGSKYHGRVSALAEAAREGGLEF